LIGGGGDDVFHISSNVNSHIVVGTSGVTTVSTYAANYILAAGVDDLQLQGTYAHNATGNGLANYITGSDGNDTISGGGGNDTFVVGTGANKLTGGGGSHELFVFSKAADHGNLVTDFHTGNDMLDFRAMMKDAIYTGADPIADHTLAVSQHGADTAIDLTIGGTAHTVVTLQNVLASSLHAGQDYIWH
jgi:Ca2+-binding RTX toxin-like protein